MENDASPLAHRFRDALARAGLNIWQGYRLISNARSANHRRTGNYLDSYCVGRRRFITEDELRRFIEARLAAARKDPTAQGRRILGAALKARRDKRAATA